MRGAEKITSGHRERSALIYVRQSSLAQVRDNTESTARQYGLVEEAVRLGWARSAVEVIDAVTGEVRAAHIFVAVLGASSLTYAEATWSETLPRVSRISRSRTWRAVTNFPSRPENGESFTRIRIRMVGGSISTNCNGVRSSRSVRVSPM